jgi:hypothetical protein
MASSGTGRWLAVRASFGACLAALGATQAAAADSGLDLYSPQTLMVSGDVRMVGVGGERSWVDDGFGKLRYGGKHDHEEGPFRVLPRVGQADVVWQPRLGWAVSATVAATVQDKDGIEAGLSEAYLSFKPLAGEHVKFSVRVGLMWPPVSLEHSGPDWVVTETITPSAINSWIGEEVKVIGFEASVSTHFGEHQLTATAALFDVNDTAGALLAFRGWALHDVKALAFRKQLLPELNEFMEYGQPRFTHPIKEMDRGYLSRPGYYVKLAWQPPKPVRIEAIHYDNGSDPEAVNTDMEWGWRTRFNNVGLVAELGPSTQLRAQAMRGHALMGPKEAGTIWIDTRFRSAFALITQRLAKGSTSGRIEAFETRNRGSGVTDDDNENGWAATVDFRRTLGEHASVLVEALHVSSRREARRREALSPRQVQTQLQAALRLHW